MNWEYLQSEQYKLDMAIMVPRGLNYNSTKTMRIVAAMVEIGEVANEIRAFKFWSNKMRSSDDVIIEELIDVLHFVLSLLNADGIQAQHADIRPYKTSGFDNQIMGLYLSVANWDGMHWKSAVQYFLGLAAMLGFSGEDLERAYRRKNEINYQRQEEGY